MTPPESIIAFERRNGKTATRQVVKGIQGRLFDPALFRDQYYKLGIGELGNRQNGSNNIISPNGQDGRNGLSLGDTASRWYMKGSNTMGNSFLSKEEIAESNSTAEKKGQLLSILPLETIFKVRLRFLHTTLQ